MLENETSTQPFDIETTRPAGFGIRLGAYLIDFLILLVPSVGGYFISSELGYLLFAIPMVCYKPVLDGMLGGTAGKLALGIRVVNESGQNIGVVSGFVRSGVFILHAIPNIVIQLKMIGQAVPKLDPQAISAFKDANNILYMTSYLILLVPLVSCLAVLTNARKKGLHDMMADSFVIHKQNLQQADEG